jgi:hypothetical protein
MIGERIWFGSDWHAETEKPGYAANTYKSNPTAKMAWAEKDPMNAHSFVLRGRYISAQRKSVRAGEYLLADKCPQGFVHRQMHGLNSSAELPEIDSVVSLRME